MKIQYSETLFEETSITMSEPNNLLTLKGDVTGDTYLSIAFPFKLSKLPPARQDLSTVQENVYVFRNPYFSEYDICFVRGLEKKGVGFLFKPTIIFNDDAKYLWKENKYLQTAIFRSFLNLFTGNISLKPNIVKTEREVDYLFQDFLPSDIIFGVFPHEWNIDFSYKYQTQLLLNLYLNGFYLLNQKDDEFYDPPYISFQQDNYDSMSFHQTKFYKHLDLVQISDKVTSNAYCSHYSANIVKHNSNQVAKFHQVYALVEIFKDEILKLELNEKICERRMASTMTGNQIQKEVLEISRDSYNISKLFTKYRNAPKDILDILFLEISYFLDNCRDKRELEDLKVFAQVYYYLRNIIVHDIQFLFIGDKQKIEKLREDFNTIIYRLEYLVLETLCHLNL
jgi:hypothetical protein